MSDPDDKNASKAAPTSADVWTFDLVPAGGDTRPIRERLAGIMAEARQYGLRTVVKSVRLELTPNRCPVPTAIAVRRTLKRAGRDYGMRAHWPSDPPELPPGATEAADADVPGVRGPKNAAELICGANGGQ